MKRFEEAGYLDWTPDRQLKPGARFFERRLADSAVQAGLPNPAISDGYDLITIDDYLVRVPSKTSLVRVKGDSMIDAGIHEGDLLVVEQQPNANVGDIVVAIVDNEFTVKYLDREKRQFRAEAGQQGLSGHPPQRAPRDLRRYGGPRAAHQVAHSMSLRSTSLEPVTSIN